MLPAGRGGEDPAQSEDSDYASQSSEDSDYGSEGEDEGASGRDAGDPQVVPRRGAAESEAANAVPVQRDDAPIAQIASSPHATESFDMPMARPTTETELQKSTGDRDETTATHQGGIGSDGTAHESIMSETQSTLSEGESENEIKKETNTLYPDGTSRVKVEREERTLVSEESLSSTEPNRSEAPPRTPRDIKFTKDGRPANGKSSPEATSTNTPVSADAPSKPPSGAETKNASTTSKKRNGRLTRTREASRKRTRHPNGENRRKGNVSSDGSYSSSSSYDEETSGGQLIPVGLCQSFLPVGADEASCSRGASCGLRGRRCRSTREPTPSGRSGSGRREKSTTRKPPWIAGPWPAPCAAADHENEAESSPSLCGCVTHGSSLEGATGGVLESILRGVRTVVRPTLHEATLNAIEALAASQPEMGRCESCSSCPSFPEVTKVRKKKIHKKEETSNISSGGSGNQCSNTG